MLLLTLRSFAVLAFMTLLSRLAYRSDPEWLAARPGGDVNQTPTEAYQRQLASHGSTSGWMVVLAIMAIMMCGWLLFVLLL
jgi:hypothetical protein